MVAGFVSVSQQHLTSSSAGSAVGHDSARALIGALCNPGGALRDGVFAGLQPILPCAAQGNTALG